MNFELDRYHNLHFWIFKRLNDELTKVDARIESTCWYIPQGIITFSILQTGPIVTINLLSCGWNSSLVFLLLKFKAPSNLISSF